MSTARLPFRFAKRSLDVGVSATLLILLAPLLAVVWLLVRWKLGSPAIFTQVRAGLQAQPFVIHKFRSMTDARDAEGNPLPDAQRITPLGRFLRRASLDELPQLWDVLRGEMSLVGPRPLYLEYVPRYSETQRRRLEVKPGITGLAQIAGRNTLGWEARLNLDVVYVDQASLGLDLLILLKTFRKVFFAEGVPSTGLDPNHKFRGAATDAPSGPDTPRDPDA